MRGQIEEDVQRLLVGVIILMVGVLLFSRVITKPACDDMAKASTVALVDAINKVAADPAYDFGNREPDLKNDAGHYIPAVVRLCQSGTATQAVFGPVANAVPGVSYFSDQVAQAEAQLGPLPLYQIYWKEAPGADAPWYAMWTESYPFSSQALGQVVFYGAIKYGPKIISKSAKLGGYLRKTIGAWTSRQVGRVWGYAQRVSMAVLRDSETKALAEMGEKYEAAVAKKASTQFIKTGVIDIAEKEGGVPKFMNDLDKIGNHISLYRKYGGKYSSAEYDKIWKAWNWQRLWKAKGFTHIIADVESDAMKEFDTLGKKFINCRTLGSCDEVAGKLFLKKGVDRKAFRLWLDNQPSAVQEQLKGIWSAPHVTDFKSIQKLWKGIKNFRFNNALVKEMEGARAEWRLWRAGIMAEGGSVERNAMTRETASHVIIETRLAYLEKPDEFRSLITKLDKNHPFRVALRKFAAGAAMDSEGLPSKEIITRFMSSREGITKLNKWVFAMPTDMELRKIQIIFDDIPGRSKSTAESLIVPGDLANDLKRTNLAGFNGKHPDIVASWMEKSGAKDMNELKSAYRTVQSSMRNIGRKVQGPMIDAQVFPKVRMQQRLYKTYLDDLFKSQNADEAERFFTILAGKASTPPASGAWRDILAKAAKDVNGKPRLKRVIIFDIGRFYTPFNPFHGAFSTREYQEKLTQNIPVSTDNSLLLTSYGVKTDLFPLDEAVKGKQIRLWRPNPSGWNMVPLGFNSLMLWIARDYYNNPKFYTVSPCMGIAKVWKDGDTIYVSMNKDETPKSKCDTSQTSTCAKQAEGLDTEANYCYADQKLLWGSSGVDVESMGVTLGAGVAGGALWAAICAIPGGQLACSASVAAMAGKFLALGLLNTWAFEDPKNDAGNEWGYWTVYKVADECDLLDIIFSVAGGKKTDPKKYEQFMTTFKAEKNYYGKVIGKAAYKKATLMTPDLCMGIYVIGEMYLQWPNRGMKKPTIDPMNQTCIYDVAGKCVWGAT